MIDWSLSFGNFLTIIILGAGGVGFVYTMRARLDVLDRRLMGQDGVIEDIQHELRKLVDILVNQGRAEERMNAIDHRLSQQGERLDQMIDRLNRHVDEHRRVSNTRPQNQ